MLIKDQLILERWSKSNRSWYEKFGYVYSDEKKDFVVKAEHLTHGSHKKVKVECDYCGKILDVPWKDYLKCSKYGLYACAKDRQKKTSDIYRNKRIDRQYKIAKSFCEQKGYKLLTSTEELHDCYSQVKYICSKHGLIYTNLLALTQNHGCQLCSWRENGDNLRLSKSEIQEIVYSYGGTLLNIDEYLGFNEKNLKMICPECGRVFLTSLNSFTKHGGQRCQECSKSESRGEYKVRLFLEQNNIEYIQQFRFDDCKYKATLPFDFYLPKLNTVIEYDGVFHFQVIRFGNEDYDEALERYQLCQKRDKIKTQYCLKNGIKIIRIPYWLYDDIDHFLKNDIIV